MLHIAFRGRNKPSKLQLRYFEALKHQERLNYTNTCRRDDFRGRETLIKGKAMYLDVKVKETKSHC